MFIIKCLLFALSLRLIPETEGDCNVPATYHVYADFLAVGIGDQNSNGVCRYSSEQPSRASSSVNLNEECPYSCKFLLWNVFGDCYCENPAYVPSRSPAVPSFLRGNTTKDLFRFLAKPSSIAKSAICRQWLNEERHDDWNCINQ